MAERVLSDMLNFKVPPKVIIDWLISDCFSEPNYKDVFDINCPKEVFITFFLDYLKNQLNSIIETANNGSKETPSKNTTPSQKKIEICKDEDVDQQLSKNNQNLNAPNIKHCVNDSELKKEMQNNKPISQDVSIETNSKIQVDNTNVNTVSPITSPQTSTPVIKKKTSLKKNRAELITCNSSQGRKINPAFVDNFEIEQANSSIENKSLSFDFNSFPSLGGNNSNSLNISSVNKSELSDLNNSNISQKSDISFPNKLLLQSPVSPLYTNETHMFSPINAKFSRSLDNANTPERNPNNFLKSSRNTPRNLSLADYIVPENRSSKKGKGNRSSCKIIRTNEQKESDDQTMVSNESSTQSKKHTRRRKVNPTRLITADEKGNKENTVFGVVSRPFTQNPQFVNVSPIDKSNDSESFQVERGLVKMERQKKPENLEVITNPSPTVCKEQEQNITILKKKTKIIPIRPIITPCKELVKNIEILNILAELYSGFLENNLVVNIMSEFYFIINLITNQYKESDKHLSEKNINYKIKNDKVELDNVSDDVKKNLSMLRKSLNFDDFHSVNELDMIDLGCSNLESKGEEHVNNISKEMDNISINQSFDDSCESIKEQNVEELINTKDCIKMYLDTPHNCVYFATQVLNYQKAFLNCLDRVTLKFLCENNQIAMFQPELRKYLGEIYSMNVADSNKNKLLLNNTIAKSNVCFQIDTDNRENFPTQAAFQNFKKQRDMFYEILKIWEDNHLQPGWSFQIVLGRKIKSMLYMHIDVMNFTHFTRLFKSQLLISCIQNGQQEDLLDDETLSFLKNLKNNDPTKLNNLQRKLITPQSQNGPVPLPSFPGIQEFYKNFILYASDSMFYVYLEDTLIHEINELNNTQFLGSDIKESETEVDEHTKQNFIICLSSLRLLSKFLGYVTALPYKSETSMLEDVIISQVSLRSNCLARIDLQSFLLDATAQGKLLLAVPWVVEYLSMMDHASFYLPYYKQVLEILYCIYRLAGNPLLMSHKVGILIKLIIGWLFELPVFPKEFLYCYYGQYHTLKTLFIVSTDTVGNIYFNTETTAIKATVSLDKLDMVDDKVLYSCCPFLKELNILLTSRNLNVNNSVSYRHVTPVTSQLKSSVKKTNTKNVQFQLEEAFFHGQPMSTKKTVEYVSERVASSCVKYIYNNLLHVEREKFLIIIQSTVEENYGELLKKKQFEKIKSILLKDMTSLSLKAGEKVKIQSKDVIPNMCESRVIQSIESLLAEDCLQSVKDMCVKIATRMAMERINQWIQSHVTSGSVFVKAMEAELNRSFKNNDCVIEEKISYNPNTATLSSIIDSIRKFIWDLLETQGQSVTVDNLSKVWDDLIQYVTTNTDLKHTSGSVIIPLSVDFFLILITYRNDLFTPTIQDKVCKLWKIQHLKLSEPDSPLLSLLSPRNVMLMSQSNNHNTWIQFGKFIKRLLNENILSIVALSSQSVALFRTDWPIPTTKSLSTCLKEAIDGFKSTDEETEKVRYLLDWVAGAYNDMDRDTFGFD